MFDRNPPPPFGLPTLTQFTGATGTMRRDPRKPSSMVDLHDRPPLCTVIPSSIISYMVCDSCNITPYHTPALGHNNTSDLRIDGNRMGRARFEVHHAKSPCDFLVGSRPEWLSLNTASDDPCDHALLPCQNLSHGCTNSSFHFGGE